MTQSDGGIPDLDCTGAKHSVWLVKVPKYVATKWMESDGGPVGKMRIMSNFGRTQVTFSLDESLAKQGSKKESLSSIPVDHKFSMQGMGNQTLAVFSRSNGPGGLEKRALEGRVVQKADCRPQGGKEYMQLKMSQIVSATKPTRTVQRLNHAVRNVYKPVSQIREEVSNAKRKKEAGKRSREDKEIVMERLFKAFEKHQYYTIQDLEKVTEQPTAYLKEIMKEIGTYNSTNPHKNMWELKPEYRHHEGAGTSDDG